MIDTPLRAIVWDFDNTLVDTRARNLSVTRRIIRDITDREPDEFPVLRSQRDYDIAIHGLQNWQEFYRVHFELTADLTRAAGRLWTPYQFEDETPTVWFEGIAAVVRALAPLPQAIVSMNTRDNIEAALASERLRSAFELVVGCGEVGYERQKPWPDGLLHCLETLTGLEPGTALYVGDHPVDAQCAANANRELEGRDRDLRVVAVGASYGTAGPTVGWPVEPRFRAEEPGDVLEIAGLGRALADFSGARAADT